MLGLLAASGLAGIVITLGGSSLMLFHSFLSFDGFSVGYPVSHPCGTGWWSRKLEVGLRPIQTLVHVWRITCGAGRFHTHRH